MEYLGNNLYRLKNDKTGETRDVPRDQLNQYGIIPPPAVRQEEPFAYKLADWLPAALGTVGMIGGGITGIVTGGAAGTVAEPGGGTVLGAFGGERVGQMVGGAIGQGVGEWLRELIKHIPVSPVEIAKQTGEGAIYGAIPETKGAGIGRKILTRAAAGFGIGAATQGIEEAGKEDTFSEVSSNVFRQGIISSIFFPVIGGGLDLGASLLKFLGEKVPEDIYETAKVQPEKVRTELHHTAQAAMVGDKNIEYNITNKLIPEKSGITRTVIDSSLEKIKNKAAEVETKTEELISQIRVPLSSVYNLITETASGIANGNLSKRVEGTLSNVLGRSLDTTGRGMDKGGLGGQTVSLSTVRLMKKELGKIYHLAGVPEAYNTLKTFIENTSGVPKEVAALGREAQTLVESNSYMTQLRDKQFLPEKLTPQAIDEAVKNAAKGNTKNLEAVIAAISLIGLPVGSVVFKSILGQLVGGIAGVFGMRYTIGAFLKAAYDNPELRSKVGNVLSTMYQNTSNFAERSMFSSALQRLGYQIFIPPTK